MSVVPSPSYLPPYSGEDVTCPKCANVGASTRYSERNEENGLWGERLIRSCRCCDYSWDEATVGPRPCGNCPSCRGESDSDSECEWPIGGQP